MAVFFRYLVETELSSARLPYTCTLFTSYQTCLTGQCHLYEKFNNVHLAQEGLEDIEEEDEEESSDEDESPEKGRQ